MFLAEQERSGRGVRACGFLFLFLGVNDPGISTHLVAFHADIRIVTFQTLDAIRIQRNTLVTTITGIGLTIIRILSLRLPTEQSAQCAASYPEPLLCQESKLEGIR